MLSRLPLVGAAVLFAALLVAQDPVPTEPEVLTRGPIHEAYAAASVDRTAHVESTAAEQQHNYDDNQE